MDKVGVGRRLGRIPIRAGREAAMEQVQAAQFFDIERRRRESPDLGCAEEMRGEGSLRAVLELHLQPTMRVVLMVCLGGFHAVDVDRRRAADRSNRGDELAPRNAGDFAEYSGKVIGRKVVENAVQA